MTSMMEWVFMVSDVKICILAFIQPLAYVWMGGFEGGWKKKSGK